MPTKIQNQTKIFNYKMKLKYNRKKMNTSLLFFTKIAQNLQFKAIFGKIALITQAIIKIVVESLFINNKIIKYSNTLPLAIIDYTRLRIIANANVMLNKGTDVEYSGLKIHIICKSIPSIGLHSRTLDCSVVFLFLFFSLSFHIVRWARLFSVIRSYTLSTSYMYFYFYLTSVQQPTTERTTKHLYYVERQSSRHY